MPWVGVGVGEGGGEPKAPLPTRNQPPAHQARASAPDDQTFDFAKSKKTKKQNVEGRSVPAPLIPSSVETIQHSQHDCCLSRRTSKCSLDSLLPHHTADDYQPRGRSPGLREDGGDDDDVVVAVTHPPLARLSSSLAFRALCLLSSHCGAPTLPSGTTELARDSLVFLLSAQDPRPFSSHRLSVPVPSRPGPALLLPFLLPSCPTRSHQEKQLSPPRSRRCASCR